jgi:DNA polymerase-3 subunit epsilon
LILFFDTETTGFVKDRLAIDDPAQPYIVQLAAELCDQDANVVGSFNFIIDNGVEIPDAASNIHGITTYKAEKAGVSPAFALSAFQHFYSLADTVVAHNVKFDKLAIEALIARVHERVMPLRKPLFCTMEAASPIVNLPPTDRMKEAGFEKPKPPKLEECIKHFFNESLDGAHDAMVDVIACRRVYFHLKGEMNA